MKKILLTLLLCCIVSHGEAISKGKHYEFTRECLREVTLIDSKERADYTFSIGEEITVYDISNTEVNLLIIREKCKKVALARKDMEELELCRIITLQK